MSENNLENENAFDELLRNNLRKHIEPIKPDFTDNILRQVQIWEERKMLAKIAMQEKIALVSGVSLFILTITVIMYFGKDILMALNLLRHNFKEAITTINTTYSFDWQLILMVAVTAGLILCCFIDKIQIRHLDKKVSKLNNSDQNF